MPKRGHDYPAQLSFGARLEDRAALRSLAFLRGSAEYAVQARLAIRYGIEKLLGEMSERERGQYEAILKTVIVEEMTLKDIKQNTPRNPAPVTLRKNEKAPGV